MAARKQAAKKVSEAEEPVEPQVDDAPTEETEPVEAAAPSPTSPFPLPAEDYIGPLTMSRKIHNDHGAVRKIQKALGQTENGIWTRQTADAVIAYQEKHDLQVTGLVDKATWDSLLTDDA